MAWEKRGKAGPYYTRTRRERGRFVREYIGAGALGERIAAQDRAEAERRQMQRAALALWEQQCRALLAEVDAIHAEALQAMRAELHAAGYHDKERGHWRRARRKTTDDATQEDHRDAGAPRGRSA